MILPDLPVPTPPTTVDAASLRNASGPARSDDALRAVAQDFEAAFIAQMLTHSGFGDAISSGEGSMGSAFNTFYIEQIADRIAESGGLGMMDAIYGQLEQYDADAPPAGTGPGPFGAPEQRDTP
ncbi:MAG: hypothetical protein AAF311_02775 [Pseudomonadota bacterium]